MVRGSSSSSVYALNVSHPRDLHASDYPLWMCSSAVGFDITIDYIKRCGINCKVHADRCCKGSVILYVYFALPCGRSNLTLIIYLDSLFLSIISFASLLRYQFLTYRIVLSQLIDCDFVSSPHNENVFEVLTSLVNLVSYHSNHRRPEITCHLQTNCRRLDFLGTAVEFSYPSTTIHFTPTF